MLTKSEFTKNVLTVMTGTGAAQAITILVSPILTRFFTPEEFGVFYLFSALADILFIPATGRYELAILIPKDEQEAANTVWTAGILTTLYSSIIFILLYFLQTHIGIWLREPKVSAYLFWIPAIIFVRGWMISFHYWHNRHKRFKIITGSKIAESSMNALSRISFGFLGFGTGGLIGGVLLARVTTLSSYLFFWKKRDGISFPEIQKDAIQKQLYRYINFPKNMIPAGLFNTTSTQLPNLLLNFFYTAAVVGHYGFMNRIIRTPLSVIGKSFDEVFKQKASEEIQKTKTCKVIFYKTLKKLLLIAVLPFIIFFLVAPWVFEFVFGEEWRTAGEYAQIFTIPIFINFITSSLSSVFYLMEKTSIFTRLNLLQLSLVIFAFFFSNLQGWDARAVIFLLAGAYSVGYLFQLFFLVKIVEE